MYVGNTPEQMMQELGYRYFYGIRRSDRGELFLGKLDTIDNSDNITVNNPGHDDENFPNLMSGEDFFEGRDINHELVYENLNYEQFMWDNQNVYFYVNDEGELVVRLNRKYDYPEGISSDGNSLSIDDYSENYIQPGYVLDGYAQSDGQE